MDEVEKKRFLWGVFLAWAPWVPVLLAVGRGIFKGISEQKATGIGELLPVSMSYSSFVASERFLSARSQPSFYSSADVRRDIGRVLCSRGFPSA